MGIKEFSADVNNKLFIIIQFYIIFVRVIIQFNSKLRSH